MADILIKICSHSHSHPIPTANYKYDLRKISNPPREMRRQFDGRAKRLREHLLRDETFATMLEDASTEINTACSAIERPSGSDTATINASLADDVEIAARDTIRRRSTSEPSVKDHLPAQEENKSPENWNIPTNEFNNEVSLPGDVEFEECVNIITVSCFCERGKHRSVAFAEELAKRLRYWQVDIDHRDINQKPAKTARPKGFRKYAQTGYGLEDDM